jgi:ribonuclease HI
MEDHIKIYTDGACSGNPGPGGYGIVLLYKGKRKEISQGFKRTTNNRMELMSVCVALETLKQDGLNVVVYSDSKYVVDSIEKGWLKNWVNKNFAKVKNPDLWIRFLKIYKRHNVKFVWVKGHASNVENNRCDELATAAVRTPPLLIDEAFEQLQNSGMYEE